MESDLVKFDIAQKSNISFNFWVVIQLNHPDRFTQIPHQRTKNQKGNKTLHPISDQLREPYLYDNFHHNPKLEVHWGSEIGVLYVLLD